MHPSAVLQSTKQINMQLSPLIGNCVDPGIICFQHCSSKIFCFTLPTQCPTCNQTLIEDELKLLPFRLPYPFVRAAQHSCAVVMRPTTGDFLNDYSNSTDLHIAVTTSNGVVVEFDQNGLQKTAVDGGSAVRANSSQWSQSLLVESVSEPWYELWDSVLDHICKQACWTSQHYDEDTNNCYTFVLKFLQALKYDRKLTDAAESKMKFCELYILPKTMAAGKYISLYRRIRDQNLYIQLIKNTRSNRNCSRNVNHNDVDDGHVAEEEVEQASCKSFDGVSAFVNSREAVGSQSHALGKYDEAGGKAVVYQTSFDRHFHYSSNSMAYSIGNCICSNCNAPNCRCPKLDTIEE